MNAVPHFAHFRGFGERAEARHWARHLRRKGLYSAIIPDGAIWVVVWGR